MKLTINPKELLALYNVLYERFETGYVGKEWPEEDNLRGATDVQLRQLYSRVKACIIASLSNKMIDPLDSWVAGQRRKIGELADQVSGVKQEARDLSANDKQEVTLDILSADDTSVSEGYPRKGPSASQGHRSGKHHDHRR
jgi:hypothetical protein